MYSTCIYCHSSLGSNVALESFPVGRRLAFDHAKGRLWVICTKCTRWNLAPFEERWEALEECERQFRETRSHAATEHVAVCFVDAETELIRVGSPPWAELSAWRYGGAFFGPALRTHWRSVARSRRRRAAVSQLPYGLAAVGAAIGIATTSPWLLGGAAVVLGMRAAVTVRARRRLMAHVESGEGWEIPITVMDFRRAMLFATGQEVGLHIPHPLAEVNLRGQEAILGLARWLPRLHPGGFTRDEVRRAAEGLEAKGSTELYFEDMARSYLTLPKYHQRMSDLSALSRLTLEMASTGRIEAGTSSADIALLERAWREAEEIAAIADSLGLPRSVEGIFAKLRNAQT